MSGGGKGLDLARVGHVRTAAQVNQVTTTIHSGTSAIGHLGFENLNLEGIVGKEFKAFLLGNDHAFKLLFALDDLLNFLLNGFV